MKPSSYLHFLFLNLPLAVSRPTAGSQEKTPSEPCEAKIGATWVPAAPPTLQSRDEPAAVESHTGRLASLNIIVGDGGSPAADKKKSKEWGLECHDHDGPNIFFTHPLLSNISFNVHTEWYVTYPGRLARKFSSEGYNITKPSERTCFWKEIRKVKKHWIERGKISIRATGDANITMAEEQLKDITKIMEDLAPTVEITVLALGLTIPIWGMLLLRACVAVIAFCCGLFMVIKETFRSRRGVNIAAHDHGSDDGGAGPDCELESPTSTEFRNKDVSSPFTTNRRWSSFGRAGSGTWKFLPAYTEEGRTVELHELRHGSSASSSAAPPYPGDMPPRYSIIEAMRDEWKHEDRRESRTDDRDS
ncbi:uncharacterized protein K452DRAFT_216 [Aplosporella prunicola CBS 121167]|uniref:Uncharacterized protein n=1 Tax=Aplosporella prunicola CBS 121167 TaxID=1176127 RepID=A0A6A6BUJ1_9PEZI|nr:uncharacterized protein K452DRAFT_216 [Aplosporella prunicola CBS 121167]KAF2147013.1 hypothetical protein K452DRAFT_216 [Aplosporella prunicola CBS 121167]